jgi:hypothetical protein
MSPPNGAGLIQLSRPEIYVKKWVDYSSKYGLGYLLSNGGTGVFFNDSTKIVLDPKTKYFFVNLWLATSSIWSEEALRSRTMWSSMA